MAWWLAGATLVSVVVSGIWTLIVGTSSMGGDEEDMVRGWTGVARNLPGYALIVVVGGIAVLFGMRARHKGVVGGGRALVAACIALFLGLASITRDAAEVVMTTRAATVSWVLAGVDLVVVGVVYVLARIRSNSA